MSNSLFTVNGHTYNDGDYNISTNATGLGAGGGRILLPQIIADIATDASVTGQMSATDSVAIGTGSKTFTPAVLRGVAVGNPILAIAGAGNLMVGVVASKTATQITITVTRVVGSGTFASWSLQPTSAGVSWLSGSGAPSGSTGNDGDLYLDTVAGDLYQKAVGAWGGAITNIKGPIGLDGSFGAFSTLGGYFQLGPWGN